MNSLNKKFYFLLFMLFSGLCLNAQDHEGDFTASGSIKSQAKTFLFGDDHKLEPFSVSALEYTSNHANISSLRMVTKQNEFLGSLAGQNGAFGLKDRNGNWIMANTDGGPTVFHTVNGIVLSLYNSGKVKIGDVDHLPGNYKLYVEDGILSESLRVAVNETLDWADFVFADEFQLMPLDDVKSFIDKNNHLPDVPSAKEMVKNGLDVLQSDAILLQKIEEAYLYIIEQEEQITEQNNKIIQQQVQIDLILKELQNTIIEKDEN